MNCKFCNEEISEQGQKEMILCLHSVKTQYAHGFCYNQWWEKCYLMDDKEAQRQKFKEEWLTRRMAQGHY